MKKCQMCDTDNRDEARFCVRCGANIEEAKEQPKEEAVSAPPPDAALPQEDETPPEAEAAPVEKGKEKEEEEPDEKAEAEEEEEAEEPPQTEEAPAQPGKETLLHNRYMLGEVTELAEGRTTHVAEDLCRCPVCGEEDNAPDDSFCQNCGASLSEAERITCYLEAYEGDTPSIPVGYKQVETFVEEGVSYVVYEASRMDTIPLEVQKPMRMTVGQRTDPGMVRSLNEDSIFAINLTSTYESRAAPSLGFYAVADGMGGHSGGEVASKMALQVIADHVMNKIFSPELRDECCLPETIRERLKEAVLHANDRVFLSRQKQGNDMGTTVTAALVKDNTVYLANVGDSRVYKWGANGLEQLTEDHSVVAGLVKAGTITREEVYTHPNRNIIYRSIGDRPEVEVDVFQATVFAGDSLLLCSDGLWEMTRDEGVEEVMMQGLEPQAACDRLVENANMAGGEDNISVIIVRFDDIP